MDIYVIPLVLAIVVLFLVYFLLDVNYFIRAIYTIIYAKFCRDRIKFLKKSTINGIVLPTDADLWITHMNNSRVFREFDFGRFDYLQRTGLLRIFWEENAGGVVGAQTCRYRRALHMFMTYKIETAPVYYDTKNIYFEQKIITLRDRIVRCVGFIKLAVNSDFEKMLKKHFPYVVKPDMPKDLELWLEYNKQSSERLRALKRLSSVGTGTDEGILNIKKTIKSEDIIALNTENSSSIQNQDPCIESHRRLLSEDDNNDNQGEAS